MHLPYWYYYDDGVEWPAGLLEPDEAKTHDLLGEVGLDKPLVDSLLRSGYGVFPYAEDVVIDRYYGGALRSSDGVTRIKIADVPAWLEGPSATNRERWTRPKHLRVSSNEEMMGAVAEVQSARGRPILYRGQTGHYWLEREVPNEWVGVQGRGEVSLLPGFWRRMLASQTKPCFTDFHGPGLLEWSKVFYSQFDIAEIDGRVDAFAQRGAWIFNAFDMEDSDDELLQEFGRLRNDLGMGLNYNLADMLNTLLQHYGLLSPYLDLATDLDVALFFATHQFVPGPPCRYDYVGTQAGKSVLYLLEEVAGEMPTWRRDRALGRLQPLRPERQHCVVSRSAALSINLPALYLIAVIELDFEIRVSAVPAVGHLFPRPGEDNFLAALASNVMHPERVTTF